MQFGTFFNQIDTAVENSEVKSLAGALEILASQGLSFVDVYANLIGNKYHTKPLLSALKNAGVLVASVFNITEFEYRKEGILEELKENAKKRLAQCAELECKLFMPVPTVGKAHECENDRLICRDKIIQHIGEVTELAKAYEINVVIENFSDVKTPFATIEDVEYILGQLPEVGYVLDTGNFWFGGSDILQAAKMFADKTVHVHLKDILPKQDGVLNICGKTADSVAMGKGIIPFNEIFKILKDSGYNKTATVEINDSGDLMNKMQESLCFLRNIDL